MTVLDLFNKVRKREGMPEPVTMEQELLAELGKGQDCDPDKALGYIAALENFDEKDERGDTALHLAARNGYADCVKALLEKGADVNALNERLLPLNDAARWGHYDCITLLIQHGADTQMKSRAGSKPLVLASMYGHTDCVELLVSIDEEKGIDDKDEALYWAACHGNKETMDVLIVAGADVNYKSPHGGDTALMQTAWRGHLDRAESLIAAGAKLNERDDNGSTALMNAANSCKIELMESLIDAGADLGIVNNDDDTALGVAKRNGRTSSFDILENPPAPTYSVLKKAQEAAERQFLDDTNFHKGLEKPMVATKPLRLGRRAV